MGQVLDVSEVHRDDGESLAGWADVLVGLPT